MSISYNLFVDPKTNSNEDKYIPLAERCRPKSIAEIIGHQKHLANDSSFKHQIKSGKIQSTIFCGPPGIGKTTLARAIASELNLPSISISAVTSGKKELVEITKSAMIEKKSSGKSTILFIDELHRFNKAQQDGLLHAIENGTIILIGATTENPSFEIISPLLSRCQVVKLDSLSKDELKEVVMRAIKSDHIFSKLDVKIKGLNTLLSLGNGDARKTLNLLEVCFNIVKVEHGKAIITEELIKKAAESNTLYYDKKGDNHYDTISAFIKSVRGSDPDAAIYYLARMLESGEDPMFIVRRLIILAAEDIGNAEPYALSLATAAMQAVHNVGMPESRIILSQVTIYLASCPKSNTAILAIDAALDDVKQNSALPIPLHLCNAPTNLMKTQGYSQGYKYPHDYKQHFVHEEYLPKKLKHKRYYFPTEMGREKAIKERLNQYWNDKYK